MVRNNKMFGLRIITLQQFKTIFPQTIPINGIATLTLSVQVLSTTGDVSAMIEKIEQQQGVRYLKILGREYNTNDKGCNYGLWHRWIRCI